MKSIHLEALVASNPFYLETLASSLYEERKKNPCLFGGHELNIYIGDDGTTISHSNERPFQYFAECQLSSSMNGLCTQITMIKIHLKSFKKFTDDSWKDVVEIMNDNKDSLDQLILGKTLPTEAVIDQVKFKVISNLLKGLNKLFDERVNTPESKEAYKQEMERWSNLIENN